MRTWRRYWPAVILLWLGAAAGAQAENRLAIIIDDIGYNRVQSEHAARLPGKFTLSVLPFTPYGTQVAQLAHSQGKELMLHLPMSNLGNIPLGKGGLTDQMTREALVATVHADLSNLPFIKGVNNHMGSRLTQDTQAMQWLMEALQGRGLYFVDSRTSPATVALTSAQTNHIPSIKRDVFLDDIEERGAIAAQLQRALSLARQHGRAVAIGHPYPSTLGVLDDIEPLLQQAQVRLVFASELVSSKLQPVTKPRLDYCPAPPYFMWERSQPKVDLYDIPAIIRGLIFGY